jgi:hypothetical protein
MYDSYTIRPAGTGWSREYSNVSSFCYNNIVMSGVNFRANYLINEELQLQRLCTDTESMCSEMYARCGCRSSVPTESLRN